MRKDVIKCPECERITPKRHPSCVYCAAVFRRGPAKGDDVFEPRMLGGKKRFTRKSDERGHYLLVPSGEPIEIEPGKRFVFGRDPRASLVFHDQEVSRQHAELTWEGDPPTPLVAEVRSTNGTFLSGKKVARDPQPVRSGDEIRLGASVRLTYLHLTERDLAKALEERTGADTRTFNVSALQASGGVKNETRALGDLVAAALGEAELTPIEQEGNFAEVNGSVLVKRLYSEQKSGVLTVYDGTAMGELHLIDGRCQSAILGVLSGRDALRHVASLDAGQFRFFAEPAEVIAGLPAPTEVDESGLALAGQLSETPGSSLVRDLVARKATGVLTLFGAETGCLVLEGGVCQEVQLGVAREREALDAVVRMQQGVFRFRPRDPSDSPSLLSADDWNAPVPGFERPPATRSNRSPLKAPPSEESVRRRATTPMRPAPGSGRHTRQPPDSGRHTRQAPDSSRHTRRQRPPLPKRRNPPPRPY